jgi:glutamate synthase (NADPH/NADH) large chain
MIGRMDRLDARDAITHWKAKGLDFSLMVAKPSAGPDVATYNCEKQDHGLDKALDNKLIELAKPALESGKPVQIEMPVRNVNRTVGAMLSGEVAKRYGHAGLPDDTIHIAMTGTAGQSFGAWVAKGVTLDLVGDANDYVGKGLSGGRLVVRPSPKSPIVPEDNIIVGNTVLYGAISGECYFHGVAGERFAVRNSGAVAVIEGVGDHGCEYMTGGCVVVLGKTGRNFAAGMSGGIAYVLDEAGDFVKRCNGDMIQLGPISTKTKSAGAMAFEDIFDDVLGDDARRLKTLIERYVHYTDSARAKTILKNWDEYLPKFLKILPVDYKRALLELRAEQAVEDKLEAEAAPALNVAAGE